MTKDEFLDKWCNDLNGGDTRHVHNDLDRVLAPYVRLRAGIQALVDQDDADALAMAGAIEDCGGGSVGGDPVMTALRELLRTTSASQEKKE